MRNLKSSKLQWCGNGVEFIILLHVTCIFILFRCMHPLSYLTLRHRQLKDQVKACVLPENLHFSIIIFIKIVFFTHQKQVKQLRSSNLK